MFIVPKLHQMKKRKLTTITTSGHKTSTPSSRPVRERRQHLEFDSIVSDNVANIYIRIVLVRFPCTSFEPIYWSHTTELSKLMILFAQNYRNILIVKVYKYAHITYKYMNCEERSSWKIEKNLNWTGITRNIFCEISVVTHTRLRARALDCRRRMSGKSGNHRSAIQ